MGLPPEPVQPHNSTLTKGGILNILRAHIRGGGPGEPPLVGLEVAASLIAALVVVELEMERRDHE
jgi:hypothetical protein